MGREVTGREPDFEGLMCIDFRGARIISDGDFLFMRRVDGLLNASHAKRRKVVKSFFKICLLAVAVIVMCGQTAWAGDTASFQWTGWYVGTHLGYGLGRTDMSTPGIWDRATGGPAEPFLSLWTLHPDPSGITGGGQVGYNLQRGSFLFGIEADISGSGMSGTDTLSPLILARGFKIPGSIISHEEINWFGTLRPRLGYIPIPRLLIYTTAGLAYGNVDHSSSITIGSVSTQFPVSSEITQAGWTAGAGIEYAIGRRWSVQVEYLYCDLGDVHITNGEILRPMAEGRSFLGATGYDFSTAFNVIDFGLNYRFR